MQTLCVVVPCHNEAARLPAEAILAFLDANAHVDFCLVDDGSRDGTLALLERMRGARADRIQVVHLEQNRGKAEAVRAGVQAALAWRSFEYVGYLDADLATPLAEIDHLLSYEPELPRRPLICGSRIRRMGATIERSEVRHYLGRVFATLASLTLRLPIYDTQCGAKLIEAELARVVFAEPFLSRWLFDVEILARATRHFGPAKTPEMILEVPLREWLEKGDSRLAPWDMLRAPLELLKIHRRYRSR